MRSFAKIIRAAFAVAILTVIASTPAREVGAACNNSPSAVDDNVTAVDEAVLIDVLANDSDPEGEALTVSLGLDNCPGDPSVDDYQLVAYAPVGIVNAPCFIKYTITDESGNTSNATIFVTGDPSLIFRDGFESGDWAKWLSCEGPCP